MFGCTARGVVVFLSTAGDAQHRRRRPLVFETSTFLRVLSYLLLEMSYLHSSALLLIYKTHVALAHVALVSYPHSLPSTPTVSKRAASKHPPLTLLIALQASISTCFFQSLLSVLSSALSLRTPR